MIRQQQRRQRRGSQAIEFAIILPVLMAIIAGMVDYGWYFYQQQRLTVAVRDGVRVGSVSEWEDDPASLAEDRVRVAYSETGLDPEALTLSASIEGSVPNKMVRVEATQAFSPMFGLVPTPGALSAVLTMRLEDQPDPADEDWYDA